MWVLIPIIINLNSGYVHMYGTLAYEQVGTQANLSLRFHNQKLMLT